MSRFVLADQAGGPTTAAGDPLEPGDRQAGAPRDMQPLVVAAVVAGAANLLSTMFVARLLSTGDYGALTKLVSLFLVLCMPGMALMVGVVRRVTAWQASAMGELVRDFMKRAHRAGVAFLVGLGVVVWAAHGPLAHLMRLPEWAGLLDVTLAGGVFLLVAMDRGVLQSRRRYRAVSWNLVIEGTGRTAGMIVLPALGFGLAGAAAGILAGELVALVHVRLALRTDSTGRRAEPLAANSTGAAVHSGRDLVADVAVAMVCMGLLALLQNADVVIFGSRSPGHSGQYAAISVPSKALVFLAILLINYLLPESSIGINEGRHAVRQLWHTLGLMLVPGLAMLGITALFSRDLVGLVFGAKYQAGAAGFSSLVLAMIFLSVTILLTTYLLGVGWRWVMAPLIAGSVVLVSLCYVFGRSLMDTVHADLVLQAGLATTMAVVCALQHRGVFRRVALVRTAPVLTPGESTTTLA